MVTIFSRSKENLTEIVPEVFGDYAVFLAFLDLSYNKLESLPESIFEAMPNLVCKLHSLNTHCYNSNLIWRTVSRRVDEVIPWGSPETRSVEGDPHGMTLSTRHDTVRQIKLLL